MLKMFMSRPAVTLLRYALTAGGSALVAKGYTDEATVTAVSGGVLALVPAVIGAISAMKQSRVASVADMPGFSVKLPSGNVVASAAQAKAALPYEDRGGHT